MADFKKAHVIVMGNEGGYANDPDDRGGETYKGISKNNFPNWKGWPLINLHKIHPGFSQNLEADNGLQALVLEFYKSNFWDALSLDNINDQRVATELYDTGVNMGTGIAAMFLQQSLNLNNNNGKDYADISEDRKIGPNTLKCCNEHKRPNEVFKTLNILQGSRYIDIIRNNPKQEKFWRSWLSRVTTAY